MTWCDAEDFISTRPDRGVDTGAAVGIDAGSFLEEPRAHFESEIGAGESSDRAEVGGVQAVIAIELPTWENANGGVGAPTVESKHGVITNFIHKPDTAVAHDAAFVIESDAWSNLQVLWLFNLIFLKAGFALAVFDGELLESALTGFIADWAVEWVVDEEKLKNRLARLFHHGGLGVDPHVFGDGIGAGDDGAGHPLDRLVPVLVENR